MGILLINIHQHPSNCWEFCSNSFFSRLLPPAALGALSGLVVVVLLQSNTQETVTTCYNHTWSVMMWCIVWYDYQFIMINVFTSLTTNDNYISPEFMDLSLTCKTVTWLTCDGLVHRFFAEKGEAFQHTPTWCADVTLPPFHRVSQSRAAYTHLFLPRRRPDPAEAAVLPSDSDGSCLTTS